MESILIARGVLPYKSRPVAGGGGDVGRGLSPAAGSLLDAIERNGVRLLQAPNLLEALRDASGLYDSEARAAWQADRALRHVGEAW